MNGDASHFDIRTASGLALPSIGIMNNDKRFVMNFVHRGAEGFH